MWFELIIITSSVVLWFYLFISFGKIDKFYEFKWCSVVGIALLKLKRMTILFYVFWTRIHFNLTCFLLKVPKENVKVFFFFFKSRYSFIVKSCFTLNGRKVKTICYSANRIAQYKNRQMMRLYYRYYTFYMYLVLKNGNYFISTLNPCCCCYWANTGAQLDYEGRRWAGQRAWGTLASITYSSLSLALPCEGVIIIIITHSVYIYVCVDKLLETNNSRWEVKREHMMIYTRVSLMYIDRCCWKTVPFNQSTRLLSSS